MTIGSTPEENYQLFFDRKCPRPKQGIFKNCLMEAWQSFMEEIVKELIVELDQPPKLNQIIKGKTGKREFHQEKLDELLSLIELLVKKKLRRTKQGMNFYQEGKNISVKALTFCILGCRLLKTANEDWNLSKIKSKIINKLLVHYYLEEGEMTNSSIQIIEKQIIAREKRKKEQLNLKVQEQPTEEGIEKYFVIDDEIEVDLENDYLESWKAFEGKKEKQLEKKFSSSGEFNFNELIRSDDKLTDTILNFCPKVEKNDITCDVDAEFYSLVMIKLIHSFLHKTELFDEIEFTTQCLQDGDYDLKYLRMLVSLYVERYGKNCDWTDERKDKFLLCSICHIVRGVVSLSKLDLIDGLDVFFKWKGKIYKIHSNELAQEKTKAIQLMQLNESRVIGEAKQETDVIVKQLPQKEKKVLFPKPVSNKIEDLKEFFKEVIQRTDFDSMLPMEIVDNRSKAIELIPDENDSEYTWIDVVLQNIDNEKLFPFLAKRAFDKLVDEEKKTNFIQTIDLQNISQEEIKVLEKIAEGCNNCKVSKSDCLKRKKEILNLIKNGNEAINKEWINQLEARSCIALLILEQIEKGFL